MGTKTKVLDAKTADETFVRPSEQHMSASAVMWQIVVPLIAFVTGCGFLWFGYTQYPHDLEGVSTATGFMWLVALIGVFGGYGD